jgi:hypothetical protein
MKGFYNQGEKSSETKVIIASFRGNEDKPRFQVWNRDWKENDELNPHQEVRGGYCYDTFERFEGIISAMDIREVTIPYQGVPKPFKRLYVVMRAGEEKAVFDLGTYTGRFAQSFLEKMLNPDLNINKSVIIFPYHFTSSDNKLMIGVGMWQGVDEAGKPKKVDHIGKEGKEALGVPEPDIIETDEGPKWVWGKRMMWMVNYAKNRLLMESEEFADEPDTLEPDPLSPELPSKGDQAAKLYGAPIKPPSTPPDPFTSDDDDGLPF